MSDAPELLPWPPDEMRRPYTPPELRQLELEQLTAEQRSWIEEDRAKARNDHKAKKDSRCICPFGVLRGDCPEHGALSPAVVKRPKNETLRVSVPRTRFRGVGRPKFRGDLWHGQPSPTPAWTTCRARQVTTRRRPLVPTCRRELVATAWPTSR